MSKELVTGDIVIDAAKKESKENVSKMRVLTPNDGAIDSIVETGKPISEHEGNQQYNPKTTAVECVFEDQLDKYVPNWRTKFDINNLAEELEAYKNQWQVTVSTYDYPIKRLEKIDQPQERKVRKQSGE
jgi:rRNA maturation endonuclease Nob1